MFILFLSFPRVGSKGTEGLNMIPSRVFWARRVPNINFETIIWESLDHVIVFKTIFLKLSGKYVHGKILFCLLVLLNMCGIFTLC